MYKKLRDTVWNKGKLLILHKRRMKIMDYESETRVCYIINYRVTEVTAPRGAMAGVGGLQDRVSITQEGH